MYDYRFDNVGGVELFGLCGAPRYLQGEDADPIRDLDKYLDENGFPNKGFDSPADAIASILEPYFEGN